MKGSLIIIAAILLFSCSPAKRTSKQVNAIETLQKQLDQQKEAILAKGIADYIKNNPCIYPEIDLDSLCDKFSGLHTTLENRNDMPHIIDYGTLDIDPSPIAGRDTVFKTKRLLVPVPDNRLVNLLKDSLQQARNKLLQCESKEAGKKEAVQDIIRITDKPNPWHFNYWALLFLTLAAVGAVFIILKYKK